MSRDQAEKRFKKLLARVIPTEKAADRFKERIQRRFGAWKSTLADALGRHNRTRSALEARKRRICEMREDGSYSAEEFRERREDVKQKLAALKKKKPSAETLTEVDRTLDTALTFISSLASTWSGYAPEVRHGFQKLVFPEGISYTSESGFGTPKLGCLFTLFDGYPHGKSSLVQPTRGIPNRLKKSSEISTWEYSDWKAFLDELKTWEQIADLVNTSKNSNLGSEKA